MEEKQKNTKAVFTSMVVLTTLFAAAIILYGIFRQRPVQGSKAITVTVVDDAGAGTEYRHRTDQEFLRGALEEIEDLKLVGEDGPYGLYVTEVNGVFAKYETNKAYWSFYLNGDYCSYAVEEQPVRDGDSFEIVYEKSGGSEGDNGESSGGE